ncbi:MAG TPA: arylesterase [Caldimonas sp.]
MNEAGVLGMKLTRRRGLAHCTALLVLAAAGSVVAAAPAGGEIILVVGDSLSAEYGLPRGSGWVALLEQRLAREGLHASVVNASISGETTAGGRSRLPALLRQHKPGLVILELGANDALRGLPLDESRANLAAMAQAAKAVGARVLIIGMRVPPNYGRPYGDQFAALFSGVARAEGAALVPFMLKGVADVPQAESLFQPDRIHPIAAAHPVILANVWTVLEPLLTQTRAGAKATGP